MSRRRTTDRRVTGRQAVERQPATSDAERRAAVSWPLRRGTLSVGLVVLLVGLYLFLFMTTGGKRAEFYEQLARVYLFIPDALVVDFLDLWTDERWAAATILDRIPLLLGTAAYLLACWSCGRLFLGMARRWITQLTRLEASLFALAIGLNVWATYVVALGWTVGFGWPWLIQVPMIFVTFAGIGAHFRDRATHGATSSRNVPTRRPTDSEQGKSKSASPRQSGAEPRSGGGDFGNGQRWSTWRPEWLLLSLVPLVAVYLLTAALPPWEFDVREYHLQTPKEWYQAGRVTFLSHNVYGNMPLGAEMPALIATFWIPGPLPWWWGALVGKLVICCMALATALAIHAFGCRFFHPLAGVMGAIAYLSTPWVFHVSVNGLVEGALGFYLFMALFALLIGTNPSADPAGPERLKREVRAQEGPDDSPFTDNGSTDANWAATMTSGYLAGAAVSCKYTGLVFVVFPLLILVTWQVLASRCQPWQIWARPGRNLKTRRLLMALPLFLVMVGAGSGVWFAKNLAFTGNPTYPLLYSVFGGNPWDDEKNARWQVAHGPQRNQAGQRFSSAQLRASVVDLGWYSDKLSPLVIPLVLFSLLERRRRDLQCVFAAFLLLNFATWWLLTHRYDRFFVPNLPVLVAWAGIGGAWLGHCQRGRYFLVPFMLLTLLVNTVLVSSGVLTGDNRILVPLKVLRVDGWRSPRVHPAHRFLNRHVPPGSAALLVGEAQVFDLEGPIYYSTCWDDCFLETWMKGRTREERLAEFRRRGISHVFVNWHEIERYRSPGNYGFTDYVTRELVWGELVNEQGILRPVPVPGDEGLLSPRFAEVFEVVGD